MKILIVDDENISRKILASKMKGLGKCVAVDNSRRALSELKAAVKKEAPFDLITLDVSMPGMDGQEMLRYIRTNEIRDKVPKEDRVKILMVTARMNMNTIKACIKAGCNGYILKPVSRVQ
ncbi:MAG: response regulator, partial [Desulfobacterales bacterium]|nr:response regulator [Desulfobacterales bacterium]